MIGASRSARSGRHGAVAHSTAAPYLGSDGEAEESWRCVHPGGRLWRPCGQEATVAGLEEPSQTQVVIAGRSHTSLVPLLPQRFLSTVRSFS